MWPGFKSRRRRRMWIEFVVCSLFCYERFFSGYSGFPLSPKTNISKFQFDQESGRRRTTLWMCYLQIIIYWYLFIHIFHINITRFVTLLVCQSFRLLWTNFQKSDHSHTFSCNNLEWRTSFPGSHSHPREPWERGCNWNKWTLPRFFKLLTWTS